LTEVKDAQWPAQNADDVQKQQKQQRETLAGTEFGSYSKAIQQRVKVKVVNPPVVDAAQTPDS
jgi:hypothetical protein